MTITPALDRRGGKDGLVHVLLNHTSRYPTAAARSNLARKQVWSPLPDPERNAFFLSGNPCHKELPSPVPVKRRPHLSPGISRRTCDAFCPCNQSLSPWAPSCLQTYRTSILSRLMSCSWRSVLATAAMLPPFHTPAFDAWLPVFYSH